MAISPTAVPLLAVSSSRSAAALTLCGGFGHPGGDLAGPGDVFRGEDGAQVRDQRLPGWCSKSAGQSPLSAV